ncbi:hypothetical protein [Streptomyces sp. NRRL S-146]|uniref:hypothetical protein n=1 Tax=Streptomyces sp. NRRL S-146 TaxID=1463884 RepID=UPI0004C92DC0|nr:hypothetical protein [Streptomyces sp. NRRL S-146]
MVMHLLLGFALVVLAWWVVATVADELIGRRIRLPDRWTLRILPGHLPAYVRVDLARARQALALARTRTPED